jgi:catechol 2,3-dioxygenase
MLTTWKLAPALASGCPVVLKPAEWTPLSASLLPEIMTEAGLPDGVFNLVHGIGEVAGAALVAHPGVPRISRTARVTAGVTPGVGEVVRAEDPLGFTVEFFFDATYVERLQQRYDLRRGAEPARLDHFNIVVPDVRAAYEYYVSLGFGLSETIEDEQTLYAAWMFRKQTVHDVAFTGGEGPRLHHLGFFAHESHQVLRICDILGSLHEEFLIEGGPGRHGVSNACYVYLRDPDGHRVEIYTSDYYTGDPGHPVLRWSVRDPRRRDFWGHAVVPSWYAEATAVLDLDGHPRPLLPEKQAAEVTVGADGFTR